MLVSWVCLFRNTLLYDILALTRSGKQGDMKHSLCHFVLQLFVLQLFKKLLIKEFISKIFWKNGVESVNIFVEEEPAF